MSFFSTTSSDDLTNAVLPFLPIGLANKQVLFVDAESSDQVTLAELVNQKPARLLVLNLNSNTTASSSSNNVEYASSSLADLNLGSQSFDLILISSAVLRQLNDSQVQQLAEKALAHLNHSSSGDTGYLLFREAPNGRTPISYIDLVESQIVEDTSTTTAKWGYTLVFVKSNDFKTAHVSFLFQKARLEDFHGFKTLREFMDHKQYSRRGVLTYEKIFGDGFVSTGGLTTTSRFLEQYLKPTAGQRLLDVGCGIGGGDFYVADKYGVEVFGLDLSSNMISIAWERASEHTSNKVHFEIGDVTKQTFPDQSFDIIYSRDTILHIPNKEGLFALFKKWLKPGGKVFITDYCSGPRDAWSSEFASYVAQRGYDLREVPAYGRIFTDLGFHNVQAVDVTDQFVASLEAELAKMSEIREAFVAEFGQKDFDYLVSGWKAKMVRCGEGNQRWGLFYCEK